MQMELGNLNHYLHLTRTQQLSVILREIYSIYIWGNLVSGVLAMIFIELSKLKMQIILH